MKLTALSVIIRLIVLAFWGVFMACSRSIPINSDVNMPVESYAQNSMSAQNSQEPLVLSETEKITEADRHSSTSTTEEKETMLANFIAGMPLNDKLGQLFIIQLRYSASGGGITELSEREREILRRVQPGGVILFRENIDTVEQVRSLIADIRGQLRTPPFIAIDEEGGTVSRLTRSGNLPATAIPSAADIASTGNACSAYLAYGVIGRELSALGFSMNFAPVADIHSRESNSLTQSRAFGGNPELVGGMVEAAVRALEENGISAVMKHFPGHGGALGDSHFTSPVVNANWEQLRGFELLPFERGLRAGSAGVLLGHLLFPQIDSNPASFSSVIVGDILRRRMSFNGLVITDALEMRGIGNTLPEEAGVLSIRAGVDMLLIPPDPLALHNALLRALFERRLYIEDIEQSIRRILGRKIEQGIILERGFADVGRRGFEQADNLSTEEVYRILGSEEHARMLELALSLDSDAPVGDCSLLLQ